MARTLEQLEEVLTEVAELRATHDQLLAAIDSLLNTMEGEAKELVSRATRDLDDDDAEELEQIAALYLHDPETHRRHLDGHLDESEWKILDRLRSRAQFEVERARLSAGAGEAVRHKLVDALRGWLQSVTDSTGGGSVEEWATVLRQWRSAVDDTFREAAEKLGVSPSGLVRYERGDRLPTAQVLAHMVDGMCGSPILADPEQQLRKARRGFERVFEESVPASTFDAWEERRVDSAQRITERLDGLSDQQRSVLDLLTESPSLLDQLATWAKARDPLAGLRAKLSVDGGAR